MNPRIKMFLLFMGMWIIFLGLGYIIAYTLLAVGVFSGSSFMVAFILVIVALLVVLNLVTYFYADKLVLRAYNVKLVDVHDAPELHSIVRDIALKANVPKPRVGIIPMRQPNAFATGRDPEHAVVAVTEGILQMLDESELKGVLAHEMAHVKDRDILVMTVAATLASIIAIVARIIFFQMMFGGRRGNSQGYMILLLIAAVTAPIAAILIQFAISRSREYKADRVGATIIRDPRALATALKKLDAGVKRYPMKSRSASPAHSSLFITNPFRGNVLVRLFSTHPPMDKRIERLEEMYADGSYLTIDV